MQYNKLSKIYKDNIQLFFTFFWILSLLYFIATIFILSIGQNVYQENYSNLTQKTINSVLPQGWGFFTRNPKETKYKIYSNVQEELNLINRKNSSPSNLFGLSRKSRRFGYEFSKIYTSINSKKWIKNDSNDITDLNLTNSDTIYIDTSYLLIKKGKYLVVKYENIPWAWASQMNNDKIIEYANIEILKKDDSK